MNGPAFGAPADSATCIEAEPFALQVVDDSMEPEFAKGCVVIIDPTGRVRDGAYVLAELEDGYIFRQLRVVGDDLELRPLNSAYPVLSIAVTGDVLRGVIVQRAGRRRSYHKRYD